MYSFIILNYNNVDETINCLEKLEAIKNKDCNFIVVDNNTLTNDEEKEVEKYTKDIIKLDDNYGYAKANNIGIEYAKDKYKSEFYIVINNDVEITQKDFLNIIEKDYKKYKFDMLGPWIDSPGESVNPFNAFSTEEIVKSEIKNCKK